MFFEVTSYSTAKAMCVAMLGQGSALYDPHTRNCVQAMLKAIARISSKGAQAQVGRRARWGGGQG